MVVRILLISLLCLAAGLGADRGSLQRDFQDPPVDCRPHTRWWWMGNALTKEDISFQLAEMQDKGIGGVEQITMGRVYERGNHDYLSPGYFDLITHAIREARRRGMEFSLNFGGPGWIWGGAWVPKEDRNKNMVASALELRGPRRFRGELPTEAVQNPRNLTQSLDRIRPDDRLLAAVVGQVEDGRLLESSLKDLTGLLEGRHLDWSVPVGRWRLMAFWLAPNETEGPVVDHFSRSAMERYCESLGAQFKAAFGGEFGRTVESMFMDSFEVPVFRNGLYREPTSSTTRAIPPARSGNGCPPAASGPKWCSAIRTYGGPTIAA